MIYNVAYTQINVHVLFWSLVIGMLLLAFLIHVAVERPVAKLMKNTLNKLADKLQNQLHCRKSAGD